jgi:hypothetical protein
MHTKECHSSGSPKERHSAATLATNVIQQRALQRATVGRRRQGTPFGSECFNERYPVTTAPTSAIHQSSSTSTIQQPVFQGALCSNERCNERQSRSCAKERHSAANVAKSAMHQRARQRAPFTKRRGRFASPKAHPCRLVRGCIGDTPPTPDLSHVRNPRPSPPLALKQYDKWKKNI